MPKWLRWLLVIPASLLGYVVGFLAMQLLSAVDGPGESSPMKVAMDYLRAIGTGGLSAYLFVRAGALTAPAHAFTTAVSLTIIFGVICGMTIFHWAFVAPLQPDRMPSWLFWPVIISSCVGPIIAVLNVRRSEGDGKPQHP